MIGRSHSCETREHWSTELTDSFVRSELEGGVLLDRLPPGTVLEIQTRNHRYRAVSMSGSKLLLSGHPQYCPTPVLVAVAGSTWGRSMLKLDFVGRGMHLEFRHPEHARPIITSAVEQIREIGRVASGGRGIDVDQSPPA